MELIYTLKGLDCPNCSAKIERDVAAMESVSKAIVNLMQQTLTVHTEQAAADELLSAITRIVHRHEPDVEVIAHAVPRTHAHEHEHHHEHGECCEHEHEHHHEHGECCEHEHEHHHEHGECCEHEHEHHHEHGECCGHEHEHHHEHAHSTAAVINPADAVQFRLEGLDCPNCAAMIEHDAAEAEGINAAAVNLVQQTLTVSAPDCDRDALLRQITEIVHKHEPDVSVSLLTPGKADARPDEGRAERIMVYRLIAGGAVFLAGLAAKLLLHAAAPVVLAIMLTAYIILGWDVVLRALRNITRGQIFDEHFLMSISTVGAFILGEYPEAAAVMLFYQIGEFFQSMAVRRSRRSIASLLDIRPDTANVLQNGNTLTVPAEQVSVGTHIIIKAGERVPLDGTVIEGESMLDTVALTGESVPRRAKPGSDVRSGCINQSGTLTVEVTKPFSESTASKIIDMVENAAARKAPTENFITTFARYYTPVVVILAVLLAVIPPLLFGGAWADWIHRAFVFLIVSCPCALVLSIPLTFFSGIGAASGCGILIKGSNDLEALSHVTQAVFDKTGTLTKGVFRVSELHPEAGYSEETLLRLAAGCERNSNHPIAKSILAAYSGDAAALDVSSCEEISGRGILAVMEGKTVLAGSGKYMAENNIPYTENNTAGTKVYVAADGIFAGCILIADELKENAADTIQKLRRSGIRKTVMLTGDDRAVAEAVAEKLRLDACHAQLLPDEKVSCLEALLEEIPAGEKLAFIGDGINDAPVLARADVGIAMGALGADAAIEAADVVLMTDEPERLADAIAIARRTKRIVRQNIVFALGVKLLLLALGACGLVGMWWAVFGDVGVTLLAVLNALRVGGRAGGQCPQPIPFGGRQRSSPNQPSTRR